MSAKPAVHEAPLVFMPLPTVKGIFDTMTDLYGLSPRASQITLANQVRDTLSAGGVCCVEAPTGTGKTLGYLAGALDAQAHSGDPIPIVVATATVGLQEQILRHDLPRLAAAGALDLRKVAVAKGRGRYFCPRTTAVLEDKKLQDGQADMFAPEKHVADGGTQIALDMLSAWREGRWDGDRDSWEHAVPECWESTCAARSETCVSRACEYYEKCAYMASRTKLSKAQVIIANHNIVLADLAQRADEQSTTALPLKRYALIFDEAHNLPEKALATREAAAPLSQTDWLRKFESYGQAVEASAGLMSRLMRSQDYQAGVFEQTPHLLLHEMEAFAKMLAEKLTFSTSGTYSWGLKPPPVEYQDEALSLAAHALTLFKSLKAVAKACGEFAEEAVGVEKGFAVRMLAQTHEHTHKIEALHKGLMAFCSEDRVVRWVYRNRDEALILHTRPLEGQDVLNELLWSTEIPVAMVSATLQIAGSFKRFRDKSGLPGHAVTLALPPVFDYTRGLLHQPDMRCLPNELGFEAELVEKIELLFKKKIGPGMLILFTSREMMRRVCGALPLAMRDCLQIQNTRPLPELIAQHKARIDQGERSILAGLDSMAEGLDLPGKYCTHVVITRLPFAVPGDPVEEARRELMGGRWFEEAYLADMLTMLIQSTGRLIRREDDHGVISVLDHRLVVKRYCATAAKALPGFSRGTFIRDYEELAKARKFDMTHGVGLKSKKPAHLSLAHSSTPTEAGGTLPTCKASASKPGVSHKSVTGVSAPAFKVLPGGVSGPVDPFEAALEPVLSFASRGTEEQQRARSVSVESLNRVLVALMPFAEGPFPEHEPEYLPGTVQTLDPALPVGSPATCWTERHLPGAIMLGLRLMNLPWSPKKPAWEQVLSLRPDLLQYVSVLRSHLNGELDIRNGLISEAACRTQLERGLAGLSPPNATGLIDALQRFEAETVALLNQSFVLPSPRMLQAMPSAAQALAKAFRSSASI